MVLADAQIDGAVAVSVVLATVFSGAATVIGAIAQRRSSVVERKLEENTALTAETTGQVADLHPKMDAVVVKLGSHDEMIAELRRHVETETVIAMQAQATREMLVDVVRRQKHEQGGNP